MTNNNLKSSLLATLFRTFLLEGVPIHHFSLLGYRKTALEVFVCLLVNFMLFLGFEKWSKNDDFFGCFFERAFWACLFVDTQSDRENAVFFETEGQSDRENTCLFTHPVFSRSDWLSRAKKGKKPSSKRL